MDDGFHGSNGDGESSPGSCLPNMTSTPLTGYGAMFIDLFGRGLASIPEHLGRQHTYSAPVFLVMYNLRAL
jgi:hypothetical protein